METPLVGSQEQRRSKKIPVVFHPHGSRAAVESRLESVWISDSLLLPNQILRAADVGIWRGLFGTDFYGIAIRLRSAFD